MKKKVSKSFQSGVGRTPRYYKGPSSIYSWSIGRILEHEFFCLGRLGSSGSKGKKVDLSFSEHLLRGFFQLFVGKKT